MISNNIKTTQSSKPHQKKYITLEDGMDFRHISKIMSKKFKMNHATARNQLLQAVEELLMNTAKELGIILSPETLEELSKSQEIHEALQDVLYLVYEKHKMKEQ